MGVSVMTDAASMDSLEIILQQYTDQIAIELSARWNSWPINLAQTEVHEVIGGLMARQITLATQLATTPSMWTGHVAPLLLRTMTDAYITLAWIWKNPQDRSQKFILYGLGQAK